MRSTGKTTMKPGLPPGTRKHGVVSSDTEVRRVLQEIVDARLGLLPENEHTGPPVRALQSGPHPDRGMADAG